MKKDIRIIEGGVEALDKIIGSAPTVKDAIKKIKENKKEGVFTVIEVKKIVELRNELIARVTVRSPLSEGKRKEV